jgi:hypothetical protein
MVTSIEATRAVLGLLTSMTYPSPLERGETSAGMLTSNVRRFSARC